MRGCHIELAEEAAEGHHFRVTDLLVTEQQHKVVYQGLADLAVGAVIHVRQVHALDLGADRAVEDVAVDEVDDVDAVAAMARNPSDEAYEYAAGEVTPPPVLFANPIGEDYFVRGFDGDKSYQWDDDWDDDAPSDE